MIDPVVPAVPQPLTMAQQRRRMRNQIIGAALLGALSAGAAASSCVGQSFSLRQARALEAIEQLLAGKAAACAPSKGTSP